MSGQGLGRASRVDDGKSRGGRGMGVAVPRLVLVVSLVLCAGSGCGVCGGCR